MGESMMGEGVIGEGMMSEAAVEAFADALNRLQLSRSTRLAIIRCLEEPGAAQRMPGLLALLKSAGEDSGRVGLLAACYFGSAVMSKVGVTL